MKYSILPILLAYSLLAEFVVSNETPSMPRKVLPDRGTWTAISQLGLETDDLAIAISMTAFGTSLKRGGHNKAMVHITAAGYGKKMTVIDQQQQQKAEAEQRRKAKEAEQERIREAARQRAAQREAEEQRIREAARQRAARQEAERLAKEEKRRQMEAEAKAAARNRELQADMDAKIAAAKKHQQKSSRPPPTAYRDPFIRTTGPRRGSFSGPSDPPQYSQPQRQDSYSQARPGSSYGNAPGPHGPGYSYVNVEPARASTSGGRRQSFSIPVRESRPAARPANPDPYATDYRYVNVEPAYVSTPGGRRQSFSIPVRGSRPAARPVSPDPYSSEDEYYERKPLRGFRNGRRQLQDGQDMSQEQGLSAKLSRRQLRRGLMDRQQAQLRESAEQPADQKAPVSRLMSKRTGSGSNVGIYPDDVTPFDFIDVVEELQLDPKTMRLSVTVPKPDYIQWRMARDSGFKASMTARPEFMHYIPAALDRLIREAVHECDLYARKKGTTCLVVQRENSLSSMNHQLFTDGSEYISAKKLRDASGQALMPNWRPQ